VSHLPPALSPWAAQLAPFAPDLALALGELARRVAAAAGSLAGARAGPGEPDGVAGLARRGPYERLLVSEWLLAEELPDEFTRRAAAGEHLFLERGRQAREAGRRSVALLDAGPDQLGAPRVAQLAVLVVLAARAEAAGATFEWGIAQDPAAGFASGFSEPLARRFLDARTALPPAPEALRAWAERLSSPATLDDLWMVGGPALLAAAPAGAARLLIEDVPDPESRSVRLELVRRGARRELVLALPPRADCSRLLRDPFRAARAAPAAAPGRVVGNAGVLFAGSGRRVAVRLDGGGILDLGVPDSPRAAAGPTVRLDGGPPGLIAYGWIRKRQSVRVIVDGVQLSFLTPRGRPLGPATPGQGTPLPVTPAPDGPLAPCHFWPAKEGELWILDAARVLHLACPGTGRSRAEAVGVAALHSSREALCYVIGREGPVELIVHRRDGSRQALPLGAGTGRAFLSRCGGRLILAKEEVETGTWTVGMLLAGSPFVQMRQLRPPSRTEVVGVTLNGADPALLLLEENRRDFTMLDRRGFRLVHGAPSAVAAAAVSPAWRAFGYTTRSGAVAVYSIDRAALLLHLTATPDRGEQVDPVMASGTAPDVGTWGAGSTRHVSGERRGGTP
jgi:hypothetical protein